MMQIHPKMKWTYVGADSHKSTHTLVFLDCFYTKLGELVVSSTPSEFEAFYQEALQFLQPHTEMVFAFEDISNYGRSLVRFLLNKGHTVKHTNAVLVANERKSYSPLHKSDSIDAECAGRVLINKFDDLPVASLDERYFILKVLVARRQSLAKGNRRLKGYLHSLLFEQYPSYFKFFGNLDAKSSLAFFYRYPSPHLLLASTVEELTELLKKSSQGLLGDERAELIFSLVQSEGVPLCTYQKQRDFTVKSTVKQLKDSIDEKAKIEIELEKFLQCFETPLTSMKGIDTITACRLIAEIGDITRFKNAAALARFAGVAPATYSSGSTSIQYATNRGNRTLSGIFYDLAMNLITLKGKNKMTLNPFFYEYYHRKLAEGKTKKQALKTVQRRLINIIFGMMKYKDDYINPPIAYVDEETGEIINDEEFDRQSELNDNQRTHSQKQLATFKDS